MSRSVTEQGFQDHDGSPASRAWLLARFAFVAREMDYWIREYGIDRAENIAKACIDSSHGTSRAYRETLPTAWGG